MKPSTRLATILCLLLCIGVIGATSFAWAELQPDQVVILANAKSPESLAVAAHYAAQRGVPLRVEALRLSADEQRWLAEAQGWVKTSRARLEQLQSAFEQIAPDSTKLDNPTNVPAQEILEMMRTMVLLPRVDQAWRAAMQYVRQLLQPASERAM